MSDLKWGFEKSYAHKVTPAKWQSNGGFTFYQNSPLSTKSFRAPAAEPMTNKGTGARDAGAYSERPQDRHNCMSEYGVHREMPWENSLRVPLVRRKASKLKPQDPRSISAPGTSRVDAAKRQSALVGAASAALRPSSAGLAK
ncbi:unnamed protein product [Prorocentrum cordatum]|uniref:Uncharacterized protein n=1 Tax=Prorocentrum cordatum TaxID=2364126 RepID=A0ABN9RR30_9DINO|nr:unnamed protein product [Polarella glacialis]